MALRGVRRRAKRRAERRRLRNERKMADLQAKIEREELGRQHDVEPASGKPVADFIGSIGSAGGKIFGGNAGQAMNMGPVLLAGGVVIAGALVVGGLVLATR